MRQRSLALLILLMAFALRLVNLNGRPLWYDEAFAILYAEKGLMAILSGTLGQVQGVAADVHPVAYYFSLHGWMTLVGQSPLAVRMLSVCYGLGAVALVYRLTRDLFSARVARWAMLVVAVAPFQIAYSQEARMYAMLGFWSVAAIASYARAWRGNSLRAWATFVVCGVFALYSHNLGFVTFAALGVWIVARLALIGFHRWPLSASGQGERALAFKTGLAGLAMATLFAPWLVNVPGQLGKIGQAYWVERPGATTLVQTLIAFAFDFENAVFPRALLPFALFGALLVLVLVIWQYWRACSRRSISSAAGAGALGGASISLLAALAIAPVALVWLISQWRPVYIIRGLLPASIFYAALVGWALAVMQRPARVVFGIPLGVLAAVTMIAFYGYTGFPRGPFLALDAFLREQSRPGDVIVHSNKLTLFPAHVYDRALPQVFLGDPPGSGSDTLARPTQEALGLFPTDLESATANRSRVWLVIFGQAMTEMKGTHSHVEWLDAHFARAQVFSFRDLNVMLFVRKGD
jgi:mannosyltransferase